MTILTREKVMDKIRKLLALSASSNVHEAEVAAAAAQRLMLEHKLAQSDITVDTTAEDIVMDAELYRDLGMKSPPRWHSILLNAVARANFCYMVVGSEVSCNGYVHDSRRVYHLMGTAEDRQAVKSIYEMLRHDVERLCDTHAYQLHFDRADRASFKLGAACSIAESVTREARAFCERTRQSANPNAIAAIDKTDRALENFVAKRFRHLRTTSRSVTVSRGNSYELGRVAGRTVDVGRGSSGAALGLKSLPAGTP